MRMTLDVAPRRWRVRIGRRTTTVLVVAVLLAAGVFGYFARYGLCEAQSKFCVLEVAGTRSEVGVEWDSWSVYVSTYPNS